MSTLFPRVLLRAAALAAGLAIAGSAAALDSIKMMIPANPGGGWDTTGRELGKAMLAAGVVKNVQYDNKGGAAGAIGLAQFESASKGDPHALMMGGMVMVGGTIQNKSAVTLAQVTPIARLTSEYEVIVVPAASPIKDMKDLMARFKANPGSISWGGGSAGGTDHILAGLLAKEVGVEPGKVNYVPYKGGGEAVAAIIGGHVSVGVSGLSEFAQHIQSGKMRAIADLLGEGDRQDPEPQGAGIQRRARQLARRLRRARDHQGAAGGAREGRRGGHEEQVLGGNPQEAGLDGLLAAGRRVRRLRAVGDEAHRRHPRRAEPRQEVTRTPG